jgi:DNA-binding XRE family transcriptional regulator
VCHYAAHEKAPGGSNTVLPGAVHGAYVALLSLSTLWPCRRRRKSPGTNEAPGRNAAKTLPPLSSAPRGGGLEGKEAREKAGLTQVQLAERTGLPVGSIGNWEQGHRTPRLGVVLTPAKAVNVPVEQLLVSMAEESSEQPAPPRRKVKGK